MQFASAAYKAEMKKYDRNESYVWIYLGVVNQQAQREAIADGDFIFFSDNTGMVVNSPDFDGYYATYEENQFKVDGSMFFLPDERPYPHYQGLVTEDVLGRITFIFGGLHEINIKGMTIDFGDYYPTEIDVTNGETSHTYAPKAGGVFTLEDTFNDSSYIQIIPRRMVGGRQRFRILSILFGIGLQFTNREIINTSRRTSIDHISKELPTKQFTFSIDNTKLKLNKDNPDSFANYLEEKQECIFEYGRKLEDGTIERIAGGVTLLRTWSSNDQQAKFTTVGRLDYMLDTYYKGRYYENGISAYDLAIDVLTDAGVSDYILDEEMKNVIIYNPLPVDTHKANLQRIANVCRAIMYEDRLGNIAIITSILPSIADIHQHNVEPYSVADNIISNNTTYNYATYEPNYFKLDGTQYFIGTDLYLPVGFVSTQADENGYFSDNPFIDVEFVSKATVNGLSLQFGDVCPAEFVVTEYKDEEMSNEYIVTEISKTTSVTAIFIDVDKIRITFTKTFPRQRIHLNKLSLAGALDYEISYRDLQSSPTSVGIPQISTLKVHMTQYTKGLQDELLQTVAATAGDNTIMLSDDAHDFRCEYSDGGLGTITIIESGAHYIIVRASREGDIDIFGKKYNITDNVYQLKMHETGTEQEWKNNLISSRSIARQIAVWLKEYFDNDVEYDVIYRGDPVIDCDDVIYLENKYVEKNLIRVTEETLNTSTGLSLQCSLKGRRVSFVNKQSVVGIAVVGTAIVGKSQTI